MPMEKFVKNAFSGFFFLQAKKCKGFPVTGRHLGLCYQCSLIYRTVSQLFEILIFTQDIWGNVYYVLKINLISYGTLIKVFHLPGRTN